MKKFRNDNYYLERVLSSPTFQDYGVSHLEKMYDVPGVILYPEQIMTIDSVCILSIIRGPTDSVTLSIHPHQKIKFYYGSYGKTKQITTLETFLDREEHDNIYINYINADNELKYLWNKKLFFTSYDHAKSYAVKNL